MWVFLHKHCAVVALFLTMMSPVADGGATKSDYYNLLDLLLTGYKREVRPVIDDVKTTDVYLTFSLLSIVDVNEQTQTLVTNGQLDIQWYDEYLAWNTTDHQGIDQVLLPQQSLWLPDIVVANTVASEKGMGYSDLLVRLTYTGDVQWTPSGVFETACDIDITFYPFDTQVCSVVFKTAVSLKSEIYIYIDKTNPIELNDYSPNGLWDLLNTSAKNLGADQGRTKIQFQMQLQRRRSFYVLNIMLPILFLSVSSSITFALPADAGEKMGLSITVLLAYAVYLTLVTDAMPSTSVQISVLTVYLVILLALTAASVVLSVWILSLHHRPEDKPVKGTLARLTLAIRKILRMSDDEDGQEEDCCKNVTEQDVLPAPVKNGPETKVTNRLTLPKLNSVAPVASTTNQSGSRSDVKLKVISGRLAAETFDKLIFIVLTTLSLGVTVISLMVIGIGSVIQENETSLSS